MNIAKYILGDWYQNKIVRQVFELLFIILPIAFVIRTFGFGLYQVPSGSMETTLLVGERFFADKLTYWFRKPRRGEIIAFNDPNHDYSGNSVSSYIDRYANLWVQNWTKRVIGVPGDHVKGVIEDGHPVIYLNGEKLDESGYVNKYPLIRVWTNPPYESSRFRPDSEWRSFVPEVAWNKQPFYHINPELVVRDAETGDEIVMIPGTPLPDGKDIFDEKLGENEYWVMGDNRLGSSDSRKWGKLDGNLIHGKIVFRIWSLDCPYPADSWFSWLPLHFLARPIAFWTEDTRWSRCLQFVS